MRRLIGLLALIAIAAAGFAVAAPAADRTDPSFGGGFVETPLSAELEKWPGSPVIWDVARDRGGGIVGALTDMSEHQGFFAAVRYRPNGALDRGFGEDGFTAELPVQRFRPQAQAIAVQRDGRILLGGYLHGSLSSRLVIARFRPDGSLDRSFGQRGIAASKVDRALRGRLHDLVIEPSGRIIAVGALGEGGIGESGRNPSGVVVAFHSDGRVDRSFGERGRVVFPAPGDNREYTGLKAVRTLAGGKLLVSGYHFGSLFLARLNRDGSLDPGFGGGDGKVLLFVHSRRLGCSGTCWSATPFRLDAAGRIVILAASFPDTPVLLRFWPDGSLDSSFGRGGKVRVSFRRHYLTPFDLTLQAGRPLVVGWDEKKHGDSVLSFAAARYLPDGRVDRGFGHGGILVRHAGEYSGAYAALNQAGQRVVAVGGAVRTRKEKAGSFLQLTRYKLR